MSSIEFVFACGGATVSDAERFAAAHVTRRQCSISWAAACARARNNEVIIIPWLVDCRGFTWTKS
eukprot:4757104-Prymnesium_polylepis.1